MKNYLLLIPFFLLLGIYFKIAPYLPFIWEVIKFLLYWWLIVTLIKLSIVIPARIFGLFPPSLFHKFSWLWLPWRPFYRLWMIPKIWNSERKYGSASTSGWANPLLLMTLLWKPGMVLLGRLRMWGLPFFQPVGQKIETHLAMFGAAGSGKSTQIMTLVSLHEGNVFVNDPAGQMVNALYEPLTRKGKKVFKLDPYHLAKHPGACWNPLDEITKAVEREGLEVAGRYAATIAEGLIMQDSKTQPVFANQARAFLAGLILYVWHAEEKKTIIRVRQLLTLGLVEKAGPKENPFAVLLWEMLQIKDYGGMIAAAAAGVERTSGTDSKNHPLSVAIEQTKFLDFEEVINISKSSDFSVSDLKTGNCSLFIVAPSMDMKTILAPWFRLLSVLTVYTFQNIPGDLKNKTLLALDEFPSLGRVEAWEAVAPEMRKFGIQLLIACQDIEQLEATYPDKWGGFIGSAEAVIFMGTNHDKTLQYISNKLGKCTKKEKIEGGYFSDIKPRFQLMERILMDPVQVGKFLEKSRQNLIVIREGKSPLKLKQARYYRELPVWMYEGNDRALARGWAESAKAFAKTPWVQAFLFGFFISLVPLIIGTGFAYVVFGTDVEWWRKAFFGVLSLFFLYPPVLFYINVAIYVVQKARGKYRVGQAPFWDDLLRDAGGFAVVAAVFWIGIFSLIAATPVFAASGNSVIETVSAHIISVILFFHVLFLMSAFRKYLRVR